MIGITEGLEFSELSTDIGGVVVVVVLRTKLQDQCLFMQMPPKVSVEFPGFIRVGIHENATMAAESDETAWECLSASAFRNLGLEDDEVLKLQCKVIRRS